MDYQEILYEIDQGVALITFNRPARLNAFTVHMVDEFQDALRRAEAEDAVRAIIITGAGRAFSAGADVAELGRIHVEAEATEGLITALRTDGHSFAGMLDLRKPVIAAINGPCAGMAFVIASYCDIRIAAQSAKMGLAFTRRGLTPEDGINWILPRLVGVGMAVELQVTGRFVDAAEARSIGLINHLVPDGQALVKAREIALDIACNCSPAAVRESKRLAYLGLSCDLQTAVAKSGEATDRMYLSEDFKEGVQAFVERRPPRFTGR